MKEPYIKTFCVKSRKILIILTKDYDNLNPHQLINFLKINSIVFLVICSIMPHSHHSA